MKSHFTIAFKYSLIWFIFTFIQSGYYMLVFKPEAGPYNYESASALDTILFYGVILAFYCCLVLSHRSYIRQVPQYTFNGILILSVLFLLITYSLGYVNGLLDYHLFYKNQAYPESQSGILGLMEVFGKSHEPSFSPFRELVWYPLSNLFYNLKEGRYIRFLHELVISRLGTIFIVIYFESLYLLFRKYGQRQWYSILPLVQKWKLVEIARKPVWYFFALLLPGVRTIIMYLVNRQLSRDFNKGPGFALGMTLLPPVFYGILGLNSAAQPERNENGLQ